MGSCDGVFEILLEISFVFFTCLILKPVLGKKLLLFFKLQISKCVV